MSDIVQKRLEEYARPFDQPSGFSSKPKDLKRMRERASANSYHSPAPPHGTKGPSSKNHVSSDDGYMPKVRRTAP